MARILLAGAEGNDEHYVAAVTAAGGCAAYGYCPDVDLSFDGLILCGGGDVDPAYYGQENTASGEIDPNRDRAEFALARAFLSAGKPILGICRGMQLLNIVLGGTLTQDIGATLLPLHRKAGIDLIHETTLAPDSFLGRLYGGTAVVNSTHHQAVNRLGDELVDIQWTESGLIEAIEHRTLPVWGVQWHPERMAFGQRRGDTIDTAALFDEFLRGCN